MDHAPSSSVPGAGHLSLEAAYAALCGLDATAYPAARERYRDAVEQREDIPRACLDLWAGLLDQCEDLVPTHLWCHIPFIVEVLLPLPNFATEVQVRSAGAMFRTGPLAMCDSLVRVAAQQYPHLLDEWCRGTSPVLVRAMAGLPAAVTRPAVRAAVRGQVDAGTQLAFLPLARPDEREDGLRLAFSLDPAATLNHLTAEPREPALTIPLDMLEEGLLSGRAEVREAAALLLHRAGPA